MVKDVFIILHYILRGSELAATVAVIPKAEEMKPN